MRHAAQLKVHLGWSAIEEALCGRLRSPEALARAQQAEDGGWPRSTEPSVVCRRLAELDGLESRLAALAEAGHGGGFLASALRDVVDVSDPLTRVRAGGVLEPIDLAEVALVVSATVALAALLEVPDPDTTEDGDAGGTEAGQALAEALAGLSPEHSLAERLQRSLDLSGDEPGLADAASPGLKKAREASRQARRDLAAAAQRLVARSDIASALADRFYTEREGRVVLPIKSGSLSRGRGGDGVAGIIHGSSTSGQTFFVEPNALVEDNNRVRQAQARARAEERLVLAALSSEIRERAEAIAVSTEAMIRLDGIAARLALSQALEGVAPRVHDPSEDNAPGLSLTQARHPGMVLAGSDVVPNDVELPVGHGMVISGPNAGGKTVALKTVGLAVLMASTGLRLPTSTPAHIPLYRHLVTDVGDDQSIAANLSTFTAHLQHVLESLRCADADGAGTLVLLDEVAVGTDPEQGAALAEAILTRLVERGATLIATTHYERLKLLAAPTDEHGVPSDTPTRFVNAAVGFDLENLAPTFKLVSGLPGSSSALAVAQRLGMPEQVLERARALVDDDKQSVDALLAQLEAQRVVLDQTRQQLADERVALKAARARLDARERGEEESDAKRRAKAHKQATAQLGELESEIKRRKKALRQAKIEVAPDGQAPAADADARSFSGQARTMLAEQAPKRPPPQGRPPDAIEVGDRVFVTAFDAEGDVVAVKGGKITVQLPNLKTTVGLDALRPRRRTDRAPKRGGSVATPAPSRARRFFGADASAFDPGFDDVVDLRGQRADEAVTMMEVFLDRAVAEDRDVVLLRHGHGSGALRKAVREALVRLRHVAEHRPGLPAEGGDAVTVVWVRG